jgi:hypothetical protein
VIDEASMLVPPLVYYTAGLATQSVTVAGDFRQLPPIVMSANSANSGDTIPISEAFPAPSLPPCLPLGVLLRPAKRRRKGKYGV